ncbi:MAG: hypothetical protein CL902_00650, partial [Dehalococcoidia bacterium]|nr:hypothetical protein [Dehalococcoidia bacterium]
GRTRATLDATTSALAYGDKVECTTFSYKRQNHFLEWVQAFQGKQKTVIPDAIITSVCEEIKAQNIEEVTEITPKDIRAILKKLKHRKYYEHSILIHHLVTGIEPPRLLPNEEDQLRCLFLAMQAPFEKFLPNDRKNFLSYSYVMYKLLELLGMDQYLSCFSLLKGKDKLARQDRIFRKICIANDWEFIPSV